MEIFKDIKSNPDYQISNLGRVWSKKSNRYMKRITYLLLIFQSA